MQQLCTEIANTKNQPQLMTEWHEHTCLRTYIKKSTQSNDEGARNIYLNCQTKEGTRNVSAQWKDKVAKKCTPTHEMMKGQEMYRWNINENERGCKFSK